MQKGAIGPEAERDDELKDILSEIPLDADLRARGVDETTIAKCEALIQAGCDAQRVDRKPAGPRTQPAEGSVEETRMVAASVKARNAVADAATAYRGLAGGASTVKEELEGRRVSLWVLEGIGGRTWVAPRVSILARALVELWTKPSKVKKIVPGIVFETIWKSGRGHLSEVLCGLLKKTGLIPTDSAPTPLASKASIAAGAKRRKGPQSTLTGDVASKFRRHVLPRLKVLADLGYVEKDGKSKPTYTPTELGCEVMRGWPDWDADPSDGGCLGRTRSKPPS